MTGFLDGWRIGARLALGYGVTIGLTLVVLAVTWFNLGRVERDNEILQTVQAERLALARQWRENILVNSTRALAVGLSADDTLQAHFSEAANAVTANTTEIQKRYAELETTEEGRAIEARLAEIRQRYLSSRDVLLQTHGDPAARAALGATFKDLVSQYVGTADDMVRLQTRRQAELGAEVVESLSATRRIFLAIALLNGLLAVGLGWRVARSITVPLDELQAVARRIADGDLNTPVRGEGRSEIAQLSGALADMQAALRDLVGQVRGSSQSIQRASQEVASGNADLSRRTEQTASSLQRTASAMEQIAGTVRHGAEVAAQADQLAGVARGVADRGGQAGEVRHLAQRSATAASEVKLLIGDSVGKVAQGTAFVSGAGTTMGEIVSSVERVSTLIGQVKVASGEQRTGIDQINQSMSELDHMTQQNAALVEQSAAASESLQDEATRLHAQVERFRV